MSTSHYSKKYIFYALFINGQKSQAEKNEIDFIHSEFHTPLHNHHLANTSLRKIITLMKIKYNLKFTFIFIYLMQVWIKPEMGVLQWDLAFQSESHSGCLWFLAFFLLFYTSSISVFHIGLKLRISTVQLIQLFWCSLTHAEYLVIKIRSAEVLHKFFMHAAV